MIQFPKTAKAKNLITLRTLCKNQVPPFFVVSSSTSNQKIITSINKYFKKPTRLIFRTSAEGEDASGSSFAGLYESVIDVKSTDLTRINEAIDKCRASLRSPRVISYLKEKSLKPSVSAEIIIQSYLKPSASGVVFLYPKDFNKSLISIGKEHNVTDGGEITATIHLDELLSFNTKKEQRINWKKLHQVISKLAKKIDQPSDIEWVIYGNQPYLVQIRPITEHLTSDMFGNVIFDSTNLGENYPGTTAPLTYSFVRSAYSGVYQNYLRLLKTKESVINQNTFATSNLIAYVEGRMYYNLENWYRLLKLLPFYKLVKTAFNRMLKPVQSLDSVDKEPTQTNILSSIFFLIYIIFPLPRTRNFEKGFSLLFDKFDVNRWKKYQTTQLYYKFEQLRDSFFSLWANTIVNDFHVMVFWGILISLANKTYKKPQFFLNSVVNASMLPESLKPLHSLVDISQEIAASQSYKELFKKNPKKVLQILSTDDEFSSINAMINNYLEKFGDRSGQELKIEVPKFSEQPEQVVQLLQMYLENKSEVTYKTTNKNNRRKLYSVKQPLLLPLVSVIKHIAIAGVYRREKYRIMRGKAYGIARSVFLEMGIRLVNQKLLESRDDVFLLTYPELSSLIMFQSLPFDPITLVSARKNQLNDFSGRKPTTRVTSYGWNSLLNELVHDQDQTSSNLKGTGTSITPPVTGEVIVLEEFSVDQPMAGKILVTKKTDPGWTVLFPMLKGVITEAGSTLSHASIIARELNIPCITNVQSCTKTLQTGDVVTLIPQTGEVIRKNT